MDDQDITKGLIDPQLAFAVISLILCFILADVSCDSSIEDLIAVLINLLNLGDVK
ncbi:TPA_asm: hypothetical protein [ssRNA phage Gerhypos.4_2]|uniref:Transmembrane protein n=2 Tax=Fiersviridae TaxID=2842319 RepID=A0A8S5KZA5_9VIRU|nr:hypothetical protein QIL50_gp2 [ssRNA phage Gerhypos.4_2]QDH89487.1 MAG: hypothetical protein H4Bulk46183_000002 [Leviviridae sp.]DAD50531.1 TPA_asm: hypothetical protein [ssRNA phage Gerhypos.4_2]